MGLCTGLTHSKIPVLMAAFQTGTYENTSLRDGAYREEWTGTIKRFREEMHKVYHVQSVTNVADG